MKFDRQKTELGTIFQNAHNASCDFLRKRYYITHLEQSTFFFLVRSEKEKAKPGVVMNTLLLFHLTRSELNESNVVVE